MSGTSMDGIDVALVKTDGVSLVEFGPTLAVEYPVRIRRRIEQVLDDAAGIQSREQRPGRTGELERELTDRHADAVIRFMAIHGLTRKDVDLLGFHGQTVVHRPDDGLTVQLGDGLRLARATGIDVVFDMRAEDMVAGGQGAPLVPVFHQALAKSARIKEPACFVNIGGISNISYVDGEQLIAFDSGPGNALIDQWVQVKGGVPYDQGGQIASEGAIIAPLVDQYLTVSYFKKPGPKSLDRGDFAPLDPSLAELSDGARTLAHVTAASIYNCTEHLPKFPKTWILCGGGRLNNSIVDDIRILAADSGGEVILAEDAELQGDMLEAQAFGYLAVRSQAGLPLTFPTTTGCNKPTTGGTYVAAESVSEIT